MKLKFFMNAAAVVLFAFALAVGAAKADFSGTWILDTKKSEGLPPGVDQVMTVTQTGDVIKLETKAMTDEGSFTIPDSYTVNGQEVDFTEQRPDGPGGKGKRTAKWTDKGIEVNEQFTRDTPDGPAQIKITRKWELSADGKTLFIELNVNGPQGTQTVKRIFNKKA